MGDLKTYDNSMVYIFCLYASENGAAVLGLVNKQISRYIKEHIPNNDQVIKITFNSVPTKLYIVQIYNSTSGATNENVEVIYQMTEETTTLPLFLKKDVLIGIDDYNAQVGSTTNDNHIQNTVGKCGLSTRHPWITI